MTTIGVFAGILDEQGHVLCVRQNYGDHSWGMPGGRLEPGEDPISALEREVLEESGVVIEVRKLVGVYSAAYQDDLVLLFVGDAKERMPWTANDEISEIGFFPPTALPEPMHANQRLRFRDVAAKVTGVVRALSAPGVAVEERSLVSSQAGESNHAKG